MSALILAIPSKGRLQEQTLDWFAASGLAIAQTGGERGYTARLPALPQVEVRLSAAAEIADGLYRGEIHLGVTGEDLLREQSPELDGVTLALPLGFGRADLVVATPKAWLDVTSVADFAAVCAERRARTGDRLRVATKYSALTRAFFAAQGVDDYRLTPSAGATEAAPAAGIAEAIVDITTTGATLAANGLKVLSDGVILKSQAQLAASNAAPWDGPALDALERLLAAAEARACAQAHVILRASAGSDDAAALAARLEAMGCQRVTQGPFGIEALVPRALASDAAWLASEQNRLVTTHDPVTIFRRPVDAFARIAGRLRRSP